MALKGREETVDAENERSRSTQDTSIFGQRDFNVRRHLCRMRSADARDVSTGLLFVEAFAVYELPLGVVAFFVGLYALTASRAHGRRLWSLGGYAIAAVILIVLVNLMLAGEELFDRLMDIYIFYL
mgnify:CR=1 FL=1